MKVYWLPTVLGLACTTMAYAGCSGSNASNSSATGGSSFGGTGGSSSAIAAGNGSGGVTSAGTSAAGGAGGKSSGGGGTYIGGSASLGGEATTAPGGATTASGGSNTIAGGSGATAAGGSTLGGSSAVTGGSSSGTTGAGGNNGTGGSNTTSGSGGTNGTAGTGGAGTGGTSDSSAGTSGSGGNNNAGAGGTMGTGGATGCSATTDTCPTGQYCNTVGSCAAGCKNSTSCVSGVCQATHDCNSCISDSECAEGRYCAAGSCYAQCNASTASVICGPAASCCTSRCVETTIDIANCGGCGAACTATQFCSRSACWDTVIASLCDAQSAVGILVNSNDDTATSNVLASLSICPVATREVAQSTGAVVNTTTGQPVLYGELLVAFGGNFFQKVVAYSETQRSTPVYSIQAATGNWQFRLSGTDQLIAELPANQIGTSHDLFAIELFRDPTTGDPLLFGYGIDVAGTAAAAWYFTNVIAPSIASFTNSWYVFEWIDSGTPGPSDLGEFTSKTLN